MTIDKGPIGHFHNEDERALRISGLSTPVATYHSHVEGTQTFHPTNFGLMPYTHTHLIRDSMSVTLKSLIGDHLDKYHPKR
jgi:hypothetical protein